MTREIDRLIEDILTNEWSDPYEMARTRKDADLVHIDGFYFFDIGVHRTMILIEFFENEATMVWAGTHQEYEAVFKNNRNVIKKWLKGNGWI